MGTGTRVSWVGGQVGRWAVGDPKVNVLRSVVPDAFGFLCGDFGFDVGMHRAPVGRPPWDRSHRFVFASPDLVIEVGLDRWATEVVTMLESTDGSPAVDLGARYVQLGLGPPQDVPCRADTAHALDKHLRLQAVALGKVLEVTRS